MVPIATIGFLIGALFFAGYAYSLWQFTTHNLVSKLYSSSFYLLGLVFVVWGLSAFMGDQESLSLSILFGNAIILLASVLISTGTLFPKNKVLMFVVFFVALILFILRVLYFPPVPYMENGVLIFNTQPLVAFIYALLFLGIWLPANLIVGKTIGVTSGAPAFIPLAQSLFALSTLMAIILPSVRTVPVVVGSFIALIVCYGALIVVNMTLGKNIRNT